MGNQIFIIDDDPDFLDSIRSDLFNAGYRDVRTESDPAKAATFFEQGQTCDIALIDLIMPNLDGMELLEIIKSHSPNTECIMITAVNDATIGSGVFKEGGLRLFDQTGLQRGIASENRSRGGKKTADGIFWN